MVRSSSHARPSHPPLRVLRPLIRSLSRRWEATIVLIGAFGRPLFTVARALLGATPPPSISQAHLISVLIYETVLGGLLGGFLSLRGWTWQRIGLRPGLVDSLMGVGLAVAAYAGYVLLWILVTTAHLQPTYLAGGTALVHGEFSLWLVLAVSLLNPLFEEVFVCGYVITVAREAGRLSWGINGSVAIRLAYHLYQGGIGVVSILPSGLIFAWWFARTGRLWPAVVAHVVMDLAAMIEYAHL